MFGTGGEFSPGRVCSYFYAFPWFKTSYQFFLLLCTVACMVRSSDFDWVSDVYAIKGIISGLPARIVYKKLWDLSEVTSV